MHDPDVHLFPDLIAGVSTGYNEDIRPSHVFATKPDKEDLAAPDLSIHLTNWKSAEDHPDVTQQLVDEEISKGWLICFDGSVEDAKQRWPHGVAIGKLGVAVSDSRPPRLVVDYTVCGTNPNCNIQEHQQLPSAKEVQRCYPLREHPEELGALGLDAKSAHKLCVIKEDHRGLVGFSLNNKLYFYKVCPFGAKFSAHWWGRLGAFWTRLLHLVIYVAHSLFLFVDDWLLVQRMDILPVTATLVTLVIQAFRLPISWRKAELDREVSWIGWNLNFSTGIIRLQHAKRDKLLKLIADLLQRPKTSKKQIEKFVGLLLWVTQIFPVMRAFIHHLYADLYKAPATLFSVDPGYWLTTIACLSDNLQFTIRPVGTAIPIGGKLLSVRHQPIQSLEDVRNCRLSDKRIWLRILDPTSNKRSLSTSSQRILRMYQEWLQHATPFVSMNPKLPWAGEAAADACAHGDCCQVGGFLRFANGDMRWFSEQWSSADFLALDIPVNSDMQKDISSYETFAQFGLLYALCYFLPGQRISITLKSLSDNTAAEANSNFLFTTKTPLCYFVERLCMLISTVHAELDVSHIAGHSNDLADRISRLPLEDPLPPDLKASERIRLPLSEIWFPFHQPTVFPKGSKVAWKLPVSRF